MQFIDDAITDFVKSGNETSQRVGEMVKQKLSSFSVEVELLLVNIFFSIIKSSNTVNS